MGFFGKNRKIIQIVGFLLEKTFQIFVFLIPSQLALHFWPKWAFVYGIRIDYLAPSIYFSDILILIIFFLWLMEFLLNSRSIKFIKSSLYLIPLLILAILNIGFATNYYLAIYKWLKFVELILLGIFIIQYKKFEIKKWIVQPLSFSIIFFVIIGLIQFVRRETIGGALYFLGERTFSIYTPGIALVELFGRQLMRTYSTFPHPNSLAGFMGISILLISFCGKRINRNIYYSAILFALLGILISFSKTVLLTLCIIGIIWLLTKKLKIENIVGRLTLILLIVGSILLLMLRINVLTPRVNNIENIYQRISLIDTSREIIKAKPFFGVGFGNFIINIPNYSQDNSWILQPVHNIYLLLFTETGLAGIIIFFILFVKVVDKTNSLRKRNSLYLLLFILLTGFFDHYWLSIQQNLLLEVIVFAMILREDINFT
ncbi:MAG TPA: O-antigen ligase family protein [Patescibacteria group bacterium]|nr:O-antigen ligase family protein [Patescibacteria group bacterium]